METPAQPDRSRPWYYEFLPPLIAFAGIILLLFFGGENWLYQLPRFKDAPQVRSLTSTVLQGQVECPLVAHPGTRLKIRGWVRSLMPGIRPSKIVVYLDGQQVGESSSLASASADSEGAAFANWQLDFLLAQAPPGEHTISIQAILEGHEPVLAAEAPLSIQ